MSRTTGHLRICFSLALGLGFWSAAARAQQTEVQPAGGPTSVEITEEGKGLVATSDRPSTATLGLLRRLEESHGGSKTVVGTFSQLKVSEIFLEEIRSTGKFHYRKPDLFRCDYDPPDEMTNLIIREAIYLHVPSIEQVEVYRFTHPEERNQQLHSMLIGFGFKSAEISADYFVHSSLDVAALVEEIEAAELDPASVSILQLVPRPARMETSPFTHLKLWIDNETLMPIKIWFMDYNGDRTELTDLAVEFDVPIADALFEAKFPPGTEVIDKTGQ